MIYPLFQQSDEKYFIFLKMLFYKVIEKKYLKLLHKLFIFILYFFSSTMNLYEILQMYTTQSNFSHISIFIRFVFENLPQQDLKVKIQINEFIYNNISPKFTKFLCENFFIFILINLNLKNF